MASETTLRGLLKTPSQIRKESQERMMEASLARSQQILRGVSGGSTALPGIIAGYGAQAAQRGAQAGAGLLRGVSGGLGQLIGADTPLGEKTIALGIPLEERQARAQQQAMRGNLNDPDELRKKIARLQQLGASPILIERLSDRLLTLESQTKEPPETRTLKIGDEFVTQQFNAKTGQFEEIARAPRYKEGTNISIDTGGEDAFTKQVGEELGSAYTTSLSAVAGAETSLQNLDVMENILDEGIIAGAFAESRTAVEKLLAQAGIIDGTRVANTEAFLAASAQQTISLLSSGVVGAGTGISNEDRAFLAKVSGADITLTEESIRKIIRLNKQVAHNIYTAHNQLVDRTRQVFPDSSKMVQERYYPGQRIELEDGTIQIFDPLQGWIDE